MTAPVFVVQSLDGVEPGGTVRLSGPEGRHAVAVRRLRVGEEIVLTDGDGGGAYGAVSALEGKDALTVAVASVRDEPPPPTRITVVQALPKGDRGEVAVETMTETGVDAIVPWAAARCVAQWRGERGAKSLAKWRAAAREAGKQARRLRFPTVADLHTTRQLGELLQGAAFAGVLHEEGAAPLATVPLPAAGGLVLIVGPEGGVAPEELAFLERSGAHAYRLGRTVLRTSTAGTVAAGVVLARVGRWD